MTLNEAVTECFMNVDLCREFERLTGRNVSAIHRRKSPIEQMVDNACNYIGASDEDMAAFLEFVVEFIILRIHPEDVS